MKLYRILIVSNHLYHPSAVIEYTFVVAGNEKRAIELCMEHWRDVYLDMSVDKSWDIENLNKEMVLA